MTPLDAPDPRNPLRSPEATAEAEGDGDGWGLANGPGRSTVGRVVSVLEALATTDGGIGPRALARETGIDRSAVSRLLRQLADQGLAVPAEVPGRYAIGPRLFAIAGAVIRRDGLRTAARPALEALATRFNETSYVAALEGAGIVYRDVIESSQPLRYVAELGVPWPLHAGASGRAVLAGMSDSAFEVWLADADLRELTPNTVTSEHDLRERRLADRTRGYAVSRAERVPGGAAIAAPFFDADDSVAGSLVVTCPSVRLSQSRSIEIGAAVRSVAISLSTRLGRRRPTAAVTREEGS